MAQFQLSDKPRLISADLTEPKMLSNGGGDTLFYARNEPVSSEENEGSLAAAESMTITNGTWIVSAGSTIAAVFDARHDRITQLEEELAAKS